MKNNLLKGLFVFLLMLSGYAQAQTVSGKVSDASGSLPGASVTVKGTTNSASTDLDGNYTIKAGADAVLVFSFIGLKTEEVKVSGRTTIDVVLKADQQELKEVMVIGYGTVRKKDATGA
ncbi:MAG: carboxypeptidase-like regulatory domain-containing protein, partial [Flavobacterium sp.]|nr:carboxypeptidase-like regulatory domain-containing protein [Flavobacterium sp.]MBP8156980.1 carboxypeptidase-like regulatory domain-containing protein [Flavobacterium sp.]